MYYFFFIYFRRSIRMVCLILHLTEVMSVLTLVLFVIFGGLFQLIGVSPLSSSCHFGGLSYGFPKLISRRLLGILLSTFSFRST